MALTHSTNAFELLFFHVFFSCACAPYPVICRHFPSAHSIISIFHPCQTHARIRSQWIRSFTSHITPTHTHHDLVLLSARHSLRAGGRVPAGQRPVRTLRDVGRAPAEVHRSRCPGAAGRSKSAQHLRGRRVHSGVRAQRNGGSPDANQRLSGLRENAARSGLDVPVERRAVIGSDRIQLQCGGEN